MRAFFLFITLLVSEAPVIAQSSHNVAPATNSGESASSTEDSGWVCGDLLRSKIDLDFAGNMAFKAQTFSKEEIERYGKEGARKELVKRAALKAISQTEFRPTSDGLNLILNNNDVELKFGVSQQFDLGLGPITLQADQTSSGETLVHSPWTNADQTQADVLLKFSPSSHTVDADVKVKFHRIPVGKASLSLACSQTDSGAVQERKDTKSNKLDAAIDDDLKETSVSLGGYESLPMQLSHDAQGHAILSGGVRLTYDAQTKKYYKLCESLGYRGNSSNPHASSKWHCRLSSREYDQVTEQGKYQISGIMLHPNDRVSHNECTEGVSYKWLPNERRILCTYGCRGRFLYILEPNDK